METKSGKAANYMSIVMFQNYPYNAHNREFFRDAGQRFVLFDFDFAQVCSNTHESVHNRSFGPVLI